MSDKMTRDEARYYVESYLTKTFIDDARRVHGNKYNYELTWLKCDENTLDEFIAKNDIEIIPHAVESSDTKQVYVEES